MALEAKSGFTIDYPAIYLCGSLKNHYRDFVYPVYNLPRKRRPSLPVGQVAFMNHEIMPESIEDIRADNFFIAQIEAKICGTDVPRIMTAYAFVAKSLKVLL